MLDSESQNPTDVQMYALKETNALVEEFMLLANITVGKKILRCAQRRKAPNCLLSRRYISIDGLMLISALFVGVGRRSISEGDHVCPSFAQDPKTEKRS